MPHRTALPRLALGERAAQLSRGSSQAGEQLARALPALRDFASFGDPKAFVSRSFLLELPCSRIHCGAAWEDSVSEVAENGEFQLYLPVSGQVGVSTDGTSLRPAPGRSLAALPGFSRRTHAGMMRSLAILTLSSDRLIKTGEHLLQDQSESLLDLERPRTISLQTGSGDFFLALTQLLGLMDSMLETPEGLKILGLEDVMHRLAARVLLAEHGFDEAEAPVLSSGARQLILGRACEAIEASDDRPLTLTELERISGASRRTLQYVFQAKFGCSPMQWQRLRRLERARRRLLSGEPIGNIATLAFEAGFASPSQFATQYKKTFGETPSATWRARGPALLTRV